MWIMENVGKLGVYIGEEVGRFDYVAVLSKLFKWREEDGVRFGSDS